MINVLTKLIWCIMLLGVASGEGEGRCVEVSIILFELDILSLSLFNSL